MTAVKGVILAAGYGTRFLPATKSVPKELFPLIDRPAVSFIMEEFAAAGIADVVVVTSRRKRALEDYLDRDPELEGYLASQGKTELLEAIQPLGLKVAFVRQDVMSGTGHALLLVRAFVGSSPFVLAYPDDLVLGGAAPLTSQLIHVFQETGRCVLAAMPVKDVTRYGVLHLDGQGNPARVRGVVEKPALKEAPSNLASFGRYLFKPELFDALEQGLKNHRGGEYYHIHAINALASQGEVMAWRFDGQPLDIGQPMGFLESICRYALGHPDYAQQARRLFQKLASG